MAFLVLKARNQMTLLPESRERENACSKKKGKWPFASMSFTEQVEDPKYPATEVERQEMCCVATL